MWRVAIYGRGIEGRAGRRALDRRVSALAAEVARRPGWCHVATYLDQSSGRLRPGLARLLADAPVGFDLVVVDGYEQLCSNHHELAATVERLRWAGVEVVVARPSRGRRLAKLVANLALADLVSEAAR
ncbi:MAG: recombinase family protein [Actinomycetota bacterium]|nr:recombinase family protein [Actinomycetota bacterium]